MESVKARTFTVPTDKPEADGTLEWQSTTMVTAEVRGGRNHRPRMDVCLPGLTDNH